MLPDFAIEHLDGRRVIREIMSFWTPEYLSEKLAKIRAKTADDLVVAVSDRLNRLVDDFERVDNKLLQFTSGIHVYDLVELAEEYAM